MGTCRKKNGDARVHSERIVVMKTRRNIGKVRRALQDPTGSTRPG